MLVADHFVPKIRTNKILDPNGYLSVGTEYLMVQSFGPPLTVATACVFYHLWALSCYSPFPVGSEP